MNEQAKLKEAQYFLSLLPGLQNDRDKFIFNLSACLSAGRSALQYARNEAETKRKGLRWYDRLVAKSKIIPFLREERNLNIHARPISPSANVKVGMGAESAFFPSLSIAVIRGDGTFEKLETPEQPTTRLNLSELVLTVEYIFQDWSGSEDVIALCEMYLKEIDAIVADGVKRGFLTA